MSRMCWMIAFIQRFVWDCEKLFSRVARCFAVIIAFAVIGILSGETVGISFGSSVTTAEETGRPNTIQRRFLEAAANELEALASSSEGGENISTLTILINIYDRLGKSNMSRDARARLATAYGAAGIEDNFLDVLRERFPASSDISSDQKAEANETVAVLHRALAALEKEQIPEVEAERYAALIVSVSNTSELSHQRVRALAKLGDATLARGHYSPALGAFVEAHLQYDDIQDQPFSGSLKDLSEYLKLLYVTQQYLARTRRGLEQTLFSTVNDGLKNTEDDTRYLEIADYAVDVFTVTGSRIYLWTMLYTKIDFYRNKGDVPNCLEHVARIYEDLISINKENLAKLMEDEIIKQLLATLNRFMNDVFADGFKKKSTDDTSEEETIAQADQETILLELRAARAWLGAMKSLGSVKKIEGAHYQPLIELIRLEASRPDPDSDTIIDLYAELIEILPALMSMLGDQAEMIEQLKNQNERLVMVAWLTALSHPIDTEIGFARFERARTLVEQGRKILGSAVPSDVGHEILYGEALVAAGRLSDAVKAYERALSVKDAIFPSFAVILPSLAHVSRALKPRSLLGFVQVRAGEIRSHLGDDVSARAHFGEALQTCGGEADRLCATRALFGRALASLRVGDWDAARADATQALECHRAWHEAVMAPVPTFSLKLKDIAESNDPMNILDQLQTSVPAQLEEEAPIIAMRARDDLMTGDVMRWAPLDIRPLFWREALVEPKAKELRPPARAREFVNLITLFGSVFLEIGDPVSAEFCYRLAERIGRDLGLGPALAAPLLRQAQLYIKDHDYADNRNANAVGPPKRMLRWSLDGVFANPAVARAKLEQAYASFGNVVDYDRILAETIVAALRAKADDLLGDDVLADWVERGREFFRENAQRFRTEPRFVKDQEDRRIVIALRSALSNHADSISDEAHTSRLAYDFPNALKNWRKAGTIYQEISNDQGLRKMLIEEIQIWQYLGEGEKIEELTEKLKISALQSDNVFETEFKENWEKPDELSSTEVSNEIELSYQIISKYLEFGLVEQADRLAANLLELTAVDQFFGSVATFSMGLAYLNADRPDRTLEFLEDADAIISSEIVHLEKNIEKSDFKLDESTVKLQIDPFAKGYAIKGSMELPAIKINLNAIKDKNLTEEQEKVLPKFDLKTMFASGYYSERLAKYRGLKARLLFLKGLAHRDLGDIAAAKAVFRESIALLEKFDAKSETAEAYHMLGRLVLPSDYDRGMSHLMRAREATSDLSQPHGALRGEFAAISIRETLAQTHFARREWASTKIFDLEAVQACEMYRENLGTPELQSPLMVKLAQSYERLVLATLRQTEANRIARGAEAFGYAESAKSRALLDAVANPRGTSGGTDELSAEEAALRNQINNLKTRLRQVAAGEADQITTELDGLRSRYSTLQTELAINRAADDFVAAVKPASLVEIQGRLAALNRDSDPETILLEYFVAEDELVIWCIEENRSDWVSIPVARSDLEAAISAFQAELDTLTPPMRNRDPLFNTLLGPFEDHLPGKRLVIVPHGALHRLPFATLRYNGKYLIQMHPLVNSPSGTLLLTLGVERSMRVPSALVLADTDGSLQFTRLEASYVESVFPRGQVVSLIGPKNATRTAFFRGAREHSIVHIATHCVFNRKFPIFSRLILGDGYLLLSDLARVGKIDADLVVLSACNSGASHIESGEELIGLVSGFLRAGAQSLLVNLWQAEDDTTPIMVKRFYEALILNKAPKDVALQTAIMSMIDNGFSPASWGGFILVGGVE